MNPCKLTHRITHRAHNIPYWVYLLFVLWQRTNSTAKLFVCDWHCLKIHRTVCQPCISKNRFFYIVETLNKEYIIYRNGCALTKVEILWKLSQQNKGSPANVIKGELSLLIKKSTKWMCMNVYEWLKNPQNECVCSRYVPMTTIIPNSCASIDKQASIEKRLISRVCCN